MMKDSLGSRRLLQLMALLALSVAARSASGQCPFVSGSTGADGAFSPTTNTTLPLPPDGVLNFTTVNIPAGVTVNFQRNSNNTPVYLLATGDVTIKGVIYVGGNNANLFFRGTGGPGGFDGGDGAVNCGGAGLGPGGGGPGCPGLGGQGLYNYGNVQLSPLIGGSGGGGAGGPTGGAAGGGGGGAGAILIATSGTLNLSGTATDVVANGGSGASFQGYQGGGGSGGAVRLVANSLTGSVSVSTVSSVGVSSERVRVEFCQTTLSNFGNASVDSPKPVFLSGIPTLTITSVGGVAAPGMPAGSYAGSPDISLTGGTTAATVQLAATGIPPDTQVSVRVIPQSGQAPPPVMGTLAGTQQTSTASADVTLAAGRSLITAQATVTIGGGGGSALNVIGSIDGEPIAKVRVSAAYGGGSSLTYITASGREIPAEIPGAL